MRSEQEAERAKLALIPQLQKAGFIVPTPEVLQTGPRWTEVRYFRSEEAGGAEQIVRILRDAQIPNVQAKYVAGYENSQRIRRNHFEVWLAPQRMAE